MKDESIQRDVFNRLFATRRRRFTLRMASMIDIIFLLLIFFLVAAKWRPEENFLPFQLPAAQSQQLIIGKPEPLIIRISATRTGCQVQIGQFHAIQIENQTIEAGLAELMGKMKDCMIAQKRFTTDPIEIICGPDVKSEYWIKICNLFYGMKLTDVTFQMTQ